MSTVVDSADAGYQETPKEERHQYYKTRICQLWKDGQCNKGDNCTYAHGEHELRRQEDNKRKRNDDDHQPKRKRDDNDKKKSRNKKEVVHHMQPPQLLGGLPGSLGLGVAGLNPALASLAGLNPTLAGGLAGLNPALAGALGLTGGGISLQTLQALQQLQGLPAGLGGLPTLSSLVTPGIVPSPLPNVLGAQPTLPSLAPSLPPTLAPKNRASVGVAGPPRRHTGPYKTKQFVFTSHHDGNGIIFFLGLNRKEGKWYNPVDTKALRVIASSLESGTLSMTVDQEFNDLLFQTKEEHPSWVVFDFLERSVRPTYYSLAHKGILESYMRSWKFEGSNDAQTWDTLCLHSNDVSLSRSSTVASWAVTTGRFYRYLRIILNQFGNSDNGSALLFNAFEVYGDLQLPSA
eukprot:NODE_3318_length_1373_cov_70.916000_g2884_i0.p1 GENE.NODE_3318_length_1373_cov_70.916000_g2884_i0~~NODE_3318_length_1373_cov_70.916000_g2884_i0.p1  ORF type:complete len:421 (+),score=87.61 NODE_3318_length_1373_cov_70.916000_g2884_i0:53-1264(+)